MASNVSSSAHYQNGQNALPSTQDIIIEDRWFEGIVACAAINFANHPGEQALWGASRFPRTVCD